MTNEVVAIRIYMFLQKWVIGPQELSFMHIVLHETPEADSEDAEYTYKWLKEACRRHSERFQRERERERELY